MAELKQNNRDNLAQISKLGCYVLPGHLRDCLPEYRKLYDEAYKFFHHFMGIEMRSEKLTDIESKLSSDAYMLFEDIFVLAYPEVNGELKIVGLFCFDTKDVTSQAMLGQSSFKAYPVEILEKYIHASEKIMTIGHLLVHPEWRRSKIGIGLSDVLVWFMHKRFAESGADLMIYFTRNNRGTDDLGTKFGGKVVVANYNYGGLDAHIIVTKIPDVVLDCGDNQVNALSQKLWDSRVICRVGGVEQSLSRQLGQ